MPTLRDTAATADEYRELTPRQTEVALLLGRGLSRAEVAAQLGCTEHTVRAHIAAIGLRLRGRGNLRVRIAVWAAHHSLRPDAALSA